MCKSKETLAFLVLLSATAISGLIAWPGLLSSPYFVAACTVIIAAFKMHLIAFRFMEVQHAPRILRFFFTGGTIALATLIIGLSGFIPIPSYF